MWVCNDYQVCFLLPFTTAEHLESWWNVEVLEKSKRGEVGKQRAKYVYIFRVREGARQTHR